MHQKYTQTKFGKLVFEKKQPKSDFCPWIPDPLLGDAPDPGRHQRMIWVESRLRTASTASATTCGGGVRPRDIQNTLCSVPRDAQRSREPRRGDGNVPSNPWGGTVGGNIISYGFCLVRRIKNTQAYIVMSQNEVQNAYVFLHLDEKCWRNFANKILESAYKTPGIFIISQIMKIPGVW